MTYHPTMPTRQRTAMAYDGAPAGRTAHRETEGNGRCNHANQTELRHRARTSPQNATRRRSARDLARRAPADGRRNRDDLFKFLGGEVAAMVPATESRSLFDRGPDASRRPNDVRRSRSTPSEHADSPVGGAATRRPDGWHPAPIHPQRGHTTSQPSLSVATSRSTRSAHSGHAWGLSMGESAMDRLLPCSACFGIDSCRRLLGQLGPDVVPVVGAQIAARHLTARDALNEHALFRGNRPPPLFLGLPPLSDLRRRNGQRPSKGALASHDPDRTHDRSAV